MDIRIRLTEDQHALVREAAELEGIPMREFARQSTLRRSRRVVSAARRSEREAAARPSPVACAPVRRGVVRRAIDAVLRAGRRAVVRGGRPGRGSARY